MFHAARLKLTAWYLLIIMLISVSFSAVVYNILTEELDRIEHIQEMRQQQIKQGMFFKQIAPGTAGVPGVQIREFTEPYLIDPQVIEEAKNRLIFRFFAINAGILALSSIAGYFLAGRTLRPIQEMVDEQHRFITDASHELRTPLTALRTELEVAMRNETLSAKETKVLFKSNLEEVIHLQQLSENLLMLTQQNKKIPRIKERVSLLETIEYSLKKVVSLARKKHITINNQVEDYILDGEQQSLTELFVILLDNSIKYSEAHKEIILTSEKKDHHFVVKVADQGQGITKRDLPYIFDRFYRSDSARGKIKTSGYGLGLAIAKEIVAVHKGKISVTSTVNKGTTFAIQFPLRHKAP